MQKPTRIFWLLALILLGVIPTLLILVWVDGNMTLPGEIHRLFQNKLGWPWLSFEESSVSVRALIDLGLSSAAYALSFGAAHLKHPQIRRAFTISVLGASLFCVMSCWQYTGIVVWVWGWAFRASSFIGEATYYTFVALSAYLTLSKMGPLEFFGFSQLYEKKNLVLSERVPSIMSVILLGLGFLFNPIMSLDRLLFSLVTLSFLTFLIRFRRLSIANSP